MNILNTNIHIHTILWRAQLTCAGCAGGGAARGAGNPLHPARHPHRHPLGLARDPAQDEE